VWDLRLTNNIEGLPLLLDDLVDIETSGDDWARYRCAEPRRINPQILRRLAERGVEVLSLAEAPRSLEDVYLSIVADEYVERGVWSMEHGGNGAPPTDGLTPRARARGAGQPLPDFEEVQR
jgi:hypothetical protein